MTYYLTISVELNADTEETAVQSAKCYLQNVSLRNAKVSLTRQGDRSGGNLLLPRTEGRMGNHLQNRKADVDEIIKA